MRILSGIQPSGTLHLGNYFGMMKPSIELQHKGEALYFIADLHALTTVRDAGELSENIRKSQSIFWRVVWIRAGRASSVSPKCRQSPNWRGS
jgi:tryptophanyl-tRNA synthetase